MKDCRKRSMEGSVRRGGGEVALLELDKKYPLDKRFDRLGELTGRGKYDAKGRVVDIWLVCIEETQDVKSAEDIVNLAGWFEETPFGELLVRARLAEKVPEGYRLKGVRQRMAWLLDYRRRQDNIKVIGGKARAATAERDERGHFKASKNPAEVQRLAGEKPAVSSASSPSVPCSLFPVPCSLNADTEQNLPASKSAGRVAGRSSGPKQEAKSTATWESYRGAYFTRYGEPPTRGVEINRALCRLIDAIGKDDAPLVAEFYLTHNDSFYVKNMHPAWLLARDAVKLRTEWATGNRMLGSKAREIERMQHNSDSWTQAAEILNERRKTNEAI